MREAGRAAIEEASERRSEQLRRLAAAGLLINSGTDTDELLAAISEQAREIIGVHLAVTSLADDEEWSGASNAVSCSEKYATWADYDAARDGGGLEALVRGDNRPVRLSKEELDEHPGRRNAGGAAASRPLRGWLAAPIVAGDGRKLGLIQVSDKEGGELTEEDEAILVHLAELSAKALENAELLRTLRQRATELAAVYDLADAVAQAETLDAVFDSALDALRRAVGVERASVVLFDAAGGIDFRAWRGLSDAYRKAVQGRLPWQARAEDPAAFVVDDVLADADVAELHEAFVREGIRSMALVPLVQGGAVFGRFVLYGDRPAAFSRASVQLAETMASHVAAAVHRRRTEAHLRESRNQLEAIFRSVTDGVTVQAADGSLVYANEAAARFSGFESRDEFLATPVADILARFEVLDEHGAPLSAGDLPGRAALVEGRESERIVQYRFVDTGERRWSVIRATPVLDEEGGVRLAINVFHDLTQQRRADERLRVLADAGRTLSSSLDVDGTLTEIAHLVVPAVADYCLVDRLDEDGTLRHVVHVHVDPEGHATLAELRRRYPVLGNPAHPVARVVATHEPLYEVEQAERALDDISLDEGHRSLYGRLAPSSFLAVPLVARGRTLGAISMGTTTGGGRRLDEEDLSLALELAERAALAVDNAVLYEEAQAEVAERQRSEERLRFLARASQVLAGSLDVEATMRSIARLAVPAVTDWCVVYELRGDGTIVRLAVEHAGGDAERVRAILDRHPLDPDADVGVARVIATREPELVAELTAEELARDTTEPNGLAEALGVEPTSLITVPLVARDRTLGAISLLTAESGRRYGSDDVELAVELARRAAVAMDNARLYLEARQSLAQLEAVLVSAPVGIGFWDRDLRYVRVNDALAEINRRPPVEHVGRTLDEVVPKLAGTLEPIYRSVLETGEPMVRAESTNADATELADDRHWLSSYFPVRTSDGETTGMAAVILEVTERERAAARFRFLARASELLAASLEIGEVVPAVAELAVGSFCDTCSVWRLESGSLVRLARAYKRAERFEAFAGLDRYDLGRDDGVPLVRVAATGEPLHMPTLGDDELSKMARSEPEQALLRDHAPRSLMILPLTVRGVVRGVVALGSDVPGRHGDEDFAAGQELARRLATALDQAELHRDAADAAELLEAVLTQMPSGIAVLDARTNSFVLHNEQAERIWGRPWGEATGEEHFASFVGFHPDGRRYEPHEWPLARALREGEVVTREAIGFERGDGSRGVMEVNATPIRNNEGRIVAGVVAFDDVTARRRAEQELEKLAATVETSSDFIAMADLDGRALYVNPAGCDLIGLDPARVVGERLIDFGTPETAAVLDRVAIPEAVREGVARGEWELRHRVSGESIAVEGTVFVVRDPATGAPFAISTVLRDVRVRKLAEAQLRESEERFRRLADTIPALVWMSDTTGGCTYFNRRWLEFTGRPMEQELGVGWYDNVHPDDVPRVRAIDAGALAEHGSFSLEYRLARHDGVYRWVLDEGLPRFTPAGEFAGHIGACIDIDDRRRAEDRQRFLAEASTMLASSLDVDETLSAVARLAVASVADWCSIALVADDGSIETVAVAHEDPERIALARRLEEQLPRDPEAPYGVAAVIRTGEPQVVSEITDELIAEVLHDRPELLEVIRGLGLRSSVVVPLVARERILGALTLVTAGESGRMLQETDVALALEIARRAATAVDNSRLFQQTEFQRAVLERQGEASIDGLLVVAPDGAILSINQRFSEIWHIPDDVVARGDEAALAAALERVEDPEGFIARVRELYARRDTSREELRFRDGRTIERYGAPVTGADGSYLGYLWSFRDITDRKRIERRLRRSEERFRSLLAATTQIIWTTDAAGAMIERSPSWEAFTGQGPREYLGPDWGWEQAIHPDDREATRAEWVAAIAEARPVVEQRYRLRRADGEYRRVEVRAVPIRDADGTVREWVGSNVDVEDERRARAEADARAEAAKALEFVADGVFLVDRYGRVALWNPAATRITGIAEEEIVGRSLGEALPGWPLDGLGERSEPLPVEVQERELWLSFSTVRFPEGTVYAFRDLTEEHALERLKSDFVSTVSHELRTPLAAIYGAAMTLQRTDVALGDDQRIGLLGVVAGESERLARIVNDVLWASRLDSGVLDVSIEGCDAEALAAAVVAAARIHLPAAIELSLVVAPDVPAVAADPDKVRQVLVNLVDNAIKYSPDGGLVEVRVEPAGRAVRFIVSDRGLGIPASEHARIFEKFFRLDPNLTRGVGGTGLGLYICQELVRRMDGRIGVESAEAAGSTFWFELPTA